jgi:hypothetical protein
MRCYGIKTKVHMATPVLRKRQRPGRTLKTIQGSPYALLWNKDDAQKFPRDPCGRNRRKRKLRQASAKSDKKSPIKTIQPVVASRAVHRTVSEHVAALSSRIKHDFRIDFSRELQSDAQKFLLSVLREDSEGRLSTLGTTNESCAPPDRYEAVVLELAQLQPVDIAPLSIKSGRGKGRRRTTRGKKRVQKMRTPSADGLRREVNGQLCPRRPASQNEVSAGGEYSSSLVNPMAQHASSRPTSRGRRTTKQAPKLQRGTSAESRSKQADNCGNSADDGTHEMIPNPFTVVLPEPDVIAPDEEDQDLVYPPPPIPLLRSQSFCPTLHRVPSWQHHTELLGVDI